MAKYLDLNVFVDSGLLQEVNRRFFHPLGLALEVWEEDDGTCILGGIYDAQWDPEGMIFTEPKDKNEDAERQRKRDRVDALMKEKCKTRMELLGYDIQPL